MCRVRREGGETERDKKVSIAKREGGQKLGWKKFNVKKNFQ